MCAAVAQAGSAAVSDDAEDLSVVSDWAVHRQKEFLAGRWCARAALAKAGYSARAALRGDGEGLPQWPHDRIGSITHSKGLVAAVAGRAADYELLAIDLERTDRIGEAAARRVIHPLEVDFANGNQLHASILFSLKEAFFKAQYAKWRISGNFEDLALAVDADRGSASVRRISPHFASELVARPQALCFRYALFDAYVVSICWLPQRSETAD